MTLGAFATYPPDCRRRQDQELFDRAYGYVREYY
jgi:hypothetical protein